MLNAVEWHVKHHRLADDSLPRIRDCQRCITAKAKCAQKIVFKDRASADERALEINIERNWWVDACVKGYRCRYCKEWHLHTAKRVEDIRRVEKMRRKWMRKTHQKINDKDFNYGRHASDWGLPEAG